MVRLDLLVLSMFGSLSAYHPKPEPDTFPQSNKIGQPDIGIEFERKHVGSNSFLGNFFFLQQLGDFHIESLGYLPTNALSKRYDVCCK